ncbi:response regulator transcription factor [Saccharicrinis aurantiacus]|uniref:response regulator transcription factor n=1 Tax=Saccharicrinis aurantiacus TaxID=1849719 RepID=UPI00094F8326|nr:response regulator transcription factor [Saccharicrinis aurantiacus]
MEDTIKILLTDDHIMIRQGLKTFLDNDEFKVVAEAQHGIEAIELLKTENIDVLITDIMMPEMNGIELVKNVSSQFPQVKILALTMLNERQNIKNMLAAGAHGYILKDCTQDELREAVRSVNKGETFYSKEVTNIIMESLTPQAKPNRVAVEIPLTKRETEILHLICKEHSNIEIAEKLFISNRTVEAHKRNLLEKTGCKNIAGLVIYALEKKLFSDI